MTSEYEGIINLSGGIDSTYVAWSLLSKNTNAKWLIHHCVLKNKQNRWQAEKISVDNILNWFRENGLSNFDYVETEFDWGNLDHSNFHDIEVIGFITGGLLRDRRYNYKQVVISRSIEDLEQGEEYFKRANTRDQIVSIMSYIPNINYSYPIQNYTREAMINFLPSDLLNLTTFCRRPQGKEFTPCGKCLTCRQTLKFLPEGSCV